MTEEDHTIKILDGDDEESVAFREKLKEAVLDEVISRIREGNLIFKVLPRTKNRKGKSKSKRGKK